MNTNRLLILMGLIGLGIFSFSWFKSRMALEFSDGPGKVIEQERVVPNVDISDLVIANNVDPNFSSLLITRLSDGRLWVSNNERSNTPYSPASTSKIPHTLIALETGTANAETLFKWDGSERSFDMWNQDQTLKTAFQRSAVWVYQEIATNIGQRDMTKWIKTFGYGNQDIGDLEDLTTYWLDGPLMISAQEQVSFLQRIVTGALPLSDVTYEEARSIFRSDQGKEWSLFSKTGWYFNENEMDIGWYVGWLEKSNGSQPEIYMFVFNMDMPTAEDRFHRKPVVHNILAMIANIPELNETK